MVLSIFTHILNNHPTIQFKNIFITPKRNSISRTSHSSFPIAPQLLATTNLFSVCMDLTILDIPYKWKHVVYDLLCLAFCTHHSVFKVHPCCSMNKYFIPFN